jgi:two-component system chemotaxis response regulator CheY
MKVLVVDDSNAIRTKLSRFLEELGHEVVGQAANGLEAVEEYKKKKPDFVTMDIVMPEMDGLAALGAILKIDANAKIVMVTSASTVSNMFEAKEAGAVGFVIKPLEKDKVAQAVIDVEKLFSTAA